ncbi:MAG: hypothetical protein V7L00_27130 [Nostoc sp.]|uniref:hypothetical protein n=1 Tax=Nostoc sp. TaxID=1180 RepID=UPI002FFC2583
MKFDTSLASFSLALIGAISGWLAWWINNEKLNKQIATQKAVPIATKAVNEERDFVHLRNNQKDISNGIAIGFNEMDRRFDSIDKELLEQKAWLIRTKSPHE